MTIRRVAADSIDQAASNSNVEFHLAPACTTRQSAHAA